LFTSSEIYENDTLWTAIRVDDRPVGLRLGFVGSIDEPRVRVDAYSEMARHVGNQLKKTLEICLGADQDLKEFYEFARGDPILKHPVRSLYGMHDTQTYSLFNSVILSICLQMARLRRSEEMMEAIDRKYGDEVEFDGKTVRLQPTAKKVASLNPDSFAKECKLGYRAKYLVASAKMIAAGFPTMMEIIEMEPDKARERLLELPGVGDYAADIIDPHGGFPIDAWSVDVFSVLFFGKLPHDRRKEIEMVKAEGVRRWGKWSWMAFFYVAQDLQNLSKRLGLELRLE
jgi:3-methyladenine DNA glycosylase/8-oxoguanine DNA glycosylase